MNDMSINTNVVHESETQRQHVRVNLPGVVEFTAGREQCRMKLCDVSAGGFCFESTRRAFRMGETHKGSLVINLDGIVLALAMSFQVRNHDPQSGRTGCAFSEIGPREISALRHLITSFLSGELVRVNDVLQTLKRDNFTKPRHAAKAQSEGGSRTFALTLTLCFAAAGALAFLYTGQQINNLLFTSTATAAKVSGPVFTLEMPREGTVRSLVPPDGMVRKGAPVATYEAPAFDLVRHQALAANMSAEQLQRMVGQTISGTVTSPCDCRVQARYIAHEQYVSRGQPLFDLVPQDFKPYVVARFRYEQLHDLQRGDVVEFQVSGDDQRRVGRITNVRAAGKGDEVESDLLVMIEPTEPIPVDMLQLPVEVAAGGLMAVSDANPLLAAQTAHATDVHKP